MIILHSCVPGADAGRMRIDDFISAIAGDRKDFMAKPKPGHGLARAIRRGLHNMKIQAYLTAAAINLKRLATALFALLWTLASSTTAIASATAKTA
jgi:hypothetical protein